VIDNAPVALKLMKNYDEFAREILTRFGDKPVDTCVTKVVGWHLPEGVLTPLSVRTWTFIIQKTNYLEITPF
jgi:hypothetical protein